MTTVTWGLLAEVAFSVLAVIAAALIASPLRSKIVGAVCCGGGLAGIWTGVVAMTGVHGSLMIVTVIPGLGIDFAPDRLGGVFIVIASAVSVLTALYGMSYAHGPANSRPAWAAMALFILGMQLVPAASGATAFLLAWELMALGSTALLLAEHSHRPRVSSATIWYATMSQLSFLSLLGGFAALSAAAGGGSFAQMAHSSPTSTLGVVAFLLFVIGFGSKAGLVPLHVWLPKAHPEAPSHVSAAMSAAMVSMGVYGVLIVCLRLLPGGPAWWGVALMTLGGISAVYGILQASVSSDIKVLLAYSTTENMGLAFLAIGASLLLSAAGAPLVAQSLLLVTLLLTVSHAAFKVTLFLAAGAAVQATGHRSLDLLGALGGRMPVTAATFAISSLGAAALPISSGFVAEWLLLQSLIHGTSARHGSVGVLVSIAMPLAVSVVALTAGLAVLTFVKAFGVGFLARPRSKEAADAHEAPLLMRIALGVGAATVLALGLLPGWLATALSSTIAPRLFSSQRTSLATIVGIRIQGLGVILNPVVILAIAVALLVVMLVIIGRIGARRRARVVDSVWGGGGDRMQPRMQYTATSYAEPILRVFDDVLKPTRDIVVTHAGESTYLVERMHVSHQMGDVVERRLYRPVLACVDWLGVQARRLQNGSVHRYVAYSLAALVIVLIWASA